MRVLLAFDREYRVFYVEVIALAIAALTRLDAESPAEKQREVEDAVSS
jgi:uncharacterized membrane protein